MSEQTTAPEQSSKTTTPKSKTIPRTNQGNPQNKKFWEFKVSADAAKSESDNTAAELILYGEISQTTWWGDEVTPKLFDSELSALGDVNEIVVRINSGGGDVFAANAIYARLKDHKAKITVKIDGWAASAATIIAMAGDVIQIPASGVFMIHNPLMGVWGYFGAEEFVAMSEELAVIKQSIINSYCLKTNKSKEEISALMDKETWLDGEQAVESGFCDEVMFGKINTEVADINRVVVNSVAMDISGFHSVPKSLLNCRLRGPSPASGNFANNKISTKEGGNKEMEIKTVDELKAAFPELTAQIEANAIAAERKRIQDIENVALPGFDEIVSKAKFDSPIDSGELAKQIIAKQREQGGKYLKNVAEDIEESGMSEVEADADKTGAEEKNPFDAAIDTLFPNVK